MRASVYIAKRISSLPAGVVTATVITMDHMLLVTLLLSLALFLIGTALISFTAGLLLALFGSVATLFIYIGFCQIFADHRGARHV